MLSGDLGRFGLDRSWSWENDLELAQAIVELGRTVNLPVYLMDRNLSGTTISLDHGVLVPLSFFDSNWAKQVRLVVIPLSYLPLAELYQFGGIIQKAAADLGRRVAVIASGDLSHALKPGAPAGYDPRGAEFDRELLELLRTKAIKEIFDLDPVLLEKAAECGFRSLIMLLGSMDGFNQEIKVLSYQGTFGVGYGVVAFRPDGIGLSLLPGLLDQRKQAIAARRSQESPLVSYSRQVVEAYVKGERLPDAATLKDYAQERAGVFVSIKKHGQLRGCIGTTAPTQENIVAEITQNAISAATRDPRFEPITRDELSELVFSVDLLKPAESISGLAELDPERYGVIVSKGFRKGLLLPHLEGVETAAEQVAIARQKAGIAPDENVELERFEVIRYN